MSRPVARENRQSEVYAINLRRIMVKLDMTLSEVSESTGVDVRTLGSLMRGASKPHTRTLRKLADGLGVSADELFQTSTLIGQKEFDRYSNAAIDQAIQAQPDVFLGWSDDDYNELYSRVGVGGALNPEGAIAYANAINRRRDLLKRASIVLESSEADLLRELIDVLYRRVTTAHASEQDLPTARPH